MSGSLVSAPTAAPLDRYGPALDFTDAWLRNRRLSEHTRTAYRGDVAGWLSWCARRDMDPLRATFLDVNAYARDLERPSSAAQPEPGFAGGEHGPARTAAAQPEPGFASGEHRSRGGSGAQPLSAASVARKLSALSSWYGFLVKLGAVPANPVAGADRPRVDRDHSATVGLTPAEVDALLAAAASATGDTAARNRVAVTLLADLGLRVGELVSLDVEDLGRERGHRSVRFVGKGGRPRRRALTPAAVEAVDAYLAARAAAVGVPAGRLTGPLLVTASGARLDRHAVFRLVRRLARDAGIPAWASLSPHSLRHAFATAARAEGVALEDVQDAMGHADPRTTRRYDRDRHNLDRDPAYAIWAARSRRSPVPGDRPDPREER
ncbi:tyrosine-type recombinase/integrase [Plantactinospora siamensis]|uniref:Tyrosine-type recombinase/integrase n=1 Tax=Plantactinospora siamensis TaxID=555372 RepID=A0ABV6NYF1_9ACTN